MQPADAQGASMQIENLTETIRHYDRDGLLAETSFT